MQELTGSPVVSSGVFADFSSGGQWSLLENRLKLANLKIEFDGTTIDGKADIKNLERLQGNFAIHIDKLNVDDFLGDENDSNASVSQSSVNKDPEINFGQLNGTIKIDSLTASNARMNNITAQVKTNHAQALISPIKADFYKGLLVTEVKIDTKAKTNKVTVKHKMNKIQAGPLLTDVAGSQLLTGLGDFNVDMKIDQPFSQSPLKTAHGQIDYTLKDGAIYGVDVFGMMQQGLNMLYPELKQNTDDGIKKTTFALMQIGADIDKGILTTNTLKLESPYLSVTGDVSIDLVKLTIKGSIQPMLLDIPEQLVSDKYSKLINLPIPVSLSGSVLEPEVKIDAKKLLLATQKRTYR